jgi:acyl-CoA synthetase (AMP-forming)/AMP-acid ligase II
MFHANGWGMVYAITGMGGRHVMLRKVDGPEILRRVDRHGVTFIGGAPAVVNTILTAASNRKTHGPRRDVRMIVGGAPPPTATIERLETELGWEFMQIYGLTETSPMLTLNRRRAEWDSLSPTERAERLGAAGPPAIGIRLRVDVDGEVLARGNAVFAGYWDQPEATAQALAGGWFHSGDGGRIDDRGHVTISDRKKDVIVSGGENVSSIEVEEVLTRHPAVADAAVIGVPDEKWGETVKAIVALRPGVAATSSELIEHCRSRLAHYKCPTSIDVQDVLPRTATGKIQKFKLRAPYWQNRTRLVS